MIHPTPMFSSRQAFALLALLLAPLAQANNIQVSNVTLINNGTTAQVQFDLIWENSWRTSVAPNNWDAAWVFVKYWNAAGVCNHANLSNMGQMAPVGSQIDLGLLTPGAAYNASTNPAVGAFIHRSADGTGTFSLTNAQLRWDYSAAGLSFTDIVLAQVFAIEVVYVPQGAFAAGSGGTETNAFTLTTINTAVANTAPSGIGSLGGQAGGYPTGQTAPGGNYPNGFNAFYCMKYEISQQAYVDFLNTLTYDQQAARTGTGPNSASGSGAMSWLNQFRSGIDIKTPGVASTVPAVYACNLDGDAVFGEAVDGKDIAAHYLSWGDFSAYLDWSGLRPMTELEFEKACRGTAAPVPDEYPWGTTGIYEGVYYLSNGGAANEGISTNYSTSLGNANCVTGGVAAYAAPLRVGIFAAHPLNSGRVTSGASYYGIMELGGNVYETLVSISAWNFTGTHGDGALHFSGGSNVANWPGVPMYSRGGAWNYNTGNARVSDRSPHAQYNNGIQRTSENGGRGVRTAP